MEVATSSIEVNCWFCNNNSQIKEELKNGWFCKNCDQYNGFDEDGGYNIDVPGQMDLKLYKTGVVCEPGEFLTADSSVLCRSCSNHQVLKVRQLANFTSISKESYDEELENYKKYLEHLYKLCQPCEIKVRECLKQQDTLLQSKMSSDQLKKLELLKTQGFDEDLNMGTTNIHKGGGYLPLTSTYAVFAGCLLLSIIRVSICLRFHAAAVVSMGARLSDYYSIFMIWIVNAVPAHGLLLLEEYIIYCGTGLCLFGLLVCGKHNLYPEDSVHLSLWLVSLFATVGSPALLLPWIPPGSACTLIMSIFTSCMALLSCIRKRRPKFCNTPPSKSRKIFADKKRRKASEALPENGGDLPAPVVDKNHSNSPPQDSREELEVKSYFEDVCQDFQTFSLGLCKKSNSNTSIWSIPAVVTSSTDEIRPSPDKYTANVDNSTEMMPDSTSDQPIPPRSVLSPSRLGFVSFDSTASRCPSPWDPILDNSKSNLDQHKQFSMSEDFQDNFESFNMNFREKPSVKQATAPKNNSVSSNTSVTNLGQSIGGASKIKNHSILEYVNPDARMEPVRLRRSYRLSGRLPKPWPLRKSLSCNNAGDLANIEKAGAASRLHYLSHLDTQETITEGNKTKADITTGHSLPQKTTVSQDSILSSPNSSLHPLGSNKKRNGAFSTYRIAGGSYQTSNPGGLNQFYTPVHNNAQSNWSTPERTYDHTNAYFNWSARNGEFSDDEAMDVDQPITDSKAKHLPRKGSGASGDQVSWKWIVIGAVIGTSVTCNVFLVIQGLWKNT